MTVLAEYKAIHVADDCSTSKTLCLECQGNGVMVPELNEARTYSAKFNCISCRTIA